MKPIPETLQDINLLAVALAAAILAVALAARLLLATIPALNYTVNQVARTLVEKFSPASLAPRKKSSFVDVAIETVSSAMALLVILLTFGSLLPEVCTSDQSFAWMIVLTSAVAVVLFLVELPLYQPITVITAMLGCRLGFAITDAETANAATLLVGLMVFVHLRYDKVRLRLFQAG